MLYKLGNMLLREGDASAGRIEECFACFCGHARLTFGPGGKATAEDAASREA